jgi:hypothetical protein
MVWAAGDRVLRARFPENHLIHPGNGRCAISDLPVIQLVMTIGEATFARSVLAF